MLHAVIMAGGSGTRFWPRSTREKPKQFLNLFGEQTMLQNTVDRISPLVPEERILVITNERYTRLVREQLPNLPLQNIIGEPVARNTAPCVALAAVLLAQQDDEATMAVLPADHQIGQPERFRSVLEAASERARQGGLVTIGIKPDRPETGYGYIRFDGNSGQTAGEHPVKKVENFTEKPDRKTAEQFIREETYLWNSGMFVWTASEIAEQFSKHQPEIHTQMEQLSGEEQPVSAEAIASFYEHCPSISIDYGIMEHADRVFVVPGSFGWNDVGSWKALYNLRDKDKEDNVAEADPLLIESSNGNLVQSDSGKAIALVGVRNLAIVETDKAILVCNLDEAQGVKQVVESLKEKKELEKYL